VTEEEKRLIIFVAITAIITAVICQLIFIWLGGIFLW